MAARRLIICFDGTWNTPDSGEKATNVVKILRAVKSKTADASQITFYDKGVGTGGGWLSKKRAGLTGAGLTENMLDGYRFVANNYVDGDEIYVFGFSRGAYTARSLVGFIGLAGLISPLGLGSELEKAVDIYRHAKLNLEKKRDRIELLQREYGNEVTTDVPIRCIGVWDTVGALGIPGDFWRRHFMKKHYFQDVQLDENVQVALHALATDEKRSSFPPPMWVRNRSASPPAGQTVEQVWFSGVHSNIGGSYADAGLSDLALDWMIKRVQDLTGLEFDQDYIADYVKPDPCGKGVESRTWLYTWLLGCKLFPYQRLINRIVPGYGGIGGWFRRISPWDRRYEPPEGKESINEMLHVTVLERWARPVVWDCPRNRACKARDYRPINLSAVIRAHQNGRSMPVVGQDGRVMSRDQVAWPQPPE